MSTPESSARGDWLSGELGDDTLVGNNRSEVLFGGAGEDIGMSETNSGNHDQ